MLASNLSLRAIYPTGSMVKSRIDRNPRYNNQPVMGAATVDKRATVAGAVAGAVAAVATAYVAAAVVVTETAMSRRQR